jgi:hypothetical protein
MSTHDDIAKKIARKYKTEYNPDKGVDVRPPGKAIEVETDMDTISHGIQQLRGYKDPRYLAVPKKIAPEVQERVKNTKIGVMDQNGNILRRAKRPGKK